MLNDTQIKYGTFLLYVIIALFAYLEWKDRQALLKQQQPKPCNCQEDGAILK